MTAQDNERAHVEGPLAIARTEPVLAQFASKVLLCLLGYLLVCQVSDSLWPAAVLSAVAISTYAACFGLQGRPPTLLHRLVARLAVPLAFAGLVLLNVFGLVGTLTGASSLVPGAGAALIALPFYLLSAAAFVVDVASRRQRVPPFIDFLVYIALPFKLLAGPLESPRLLNQIANFRLALRPVRLMAAWPWIALGGFMKYVIANRLDPARHLIHTDPITSLATAAIFELKFYFDFAGYSFMAYGGALALGLRISQNFNHPFLASNVVLFWRCWHMSLGRFLTRYVLEPNLSIWRGREQKMLFASSIFLVSAMWHGGTLNYLCWGLFHGACYYGYGRWIKRRAIPAALGTGAMILFFVLGRMLAIDADAGRLIRRLVSFIEPQSYLAASGWESDAFLSAAEANALLLASVFLAAEIWSQRRWRRPQGYHLLRKPWVALGLLMAFLIFGLGNGALLYARI